MSRNTPPPSTQAAHAALETENRRLQAGNARLGELYSFLLQLPSLQTRQSLDTDRLRRGLEGLMTPAQARHGAHGPFGEARAPPPVIHPRLNAGPAARWGVAGRRFSSMNSPGYG